MFSATNKYFTELDAQKFLQMIREDQSILQEKYGNYFSYNSSDCTDDNERALSYIKSTTYNLFVKLSATLLGHFSNCQSLGCFVPQSLDWDLTFSHCMMNVYDICFQIMNSQDTNICDIYNYPPESKRHDFSDYTYEKPKTSKKEKTSIYKKMSTLKKELKKANLSDWFQIKDDKENNGRSGALLQSQLQLLLSIMFSNNKCNDKFFLHKHMSIYNSNNSHPSKRTIGIIRDFDCLPVKSSFQLPCLHVIESGHTTNGLFFPGYSPFMHTLSSTSPLMSIEHNSSTTLSAFDYYCNYKLESIFNLQLGYQIFETYILLPELADHDIKIDDLCFLGESSNILYRYTLFTTSLREYISKYLRYCDEVAKIKEQYQKEKQNPELATIAAGNRLRHYNVRFHNTPSPFPFNVIEEIGSNSFKVADHNFYPCSPRTNQHKNSTRSSSCFMTMAPNIWLEKYKEFMSSYEGYVLALCERSLFYQLYDYFIKIGGTPSYNDLNHHTIINSMFDLASDYIEHDNNWKLFQNINCENSLKFSNPKPNGNDKYNDTAKPQMNDEDDLLFIDPIIYDNRPENAIKIQKYSTVPIVFSKIVKYSNKKGFPFSQLNDKIEKEAQPRYEPTDYCAKIKIRRR